MAIKTERERKAALIRNKWNTDRYSEQATQVYVTLKIAMLTVGVCLLNYIWRFNMVYVFPV